MVRHVQNAGEDLRLWLYERHGHAPACPHLGRFCGGIRLNSSPALRKPTNGFSSVGCRSRGHHDRDLITGVAMGNSEAFHELYVKYRRRVACFIAHMNQRHDDVEEIINDTFMIVWQSASEFHHASQVSTWIFGIAYRNALKSLRRQRKHTRNVRLEDAPEQSTDPMPETEMRDWLTQGLRQLPPPQRLTLQLGYQLGLCLEEIAAITGAPIGTVKARQYHARLKLRRCLPTLGGGPQFPKDTARPATAS
jgi:RNA polymerase sigma-70 factor, ECF subfamily